MITKININEYLNFRSLDFGGYKIVSIAKGDYQFNAGEVIATAWTTYHEKSVHVCTLDGFWVLFPRSPIDQIARILTGKTEVKQVEVYAPGGKLVGKVYPGSECCSLNTDDVKKIFNLIKCHVYKMDAEAIRNPAYIVWDDNGKPGKIGYSECNDPIMSIIKSAHKHGITIDHIDKLGRVF